MNSLHIEKKYGLDEEQFWLEASWNNQKLGKVFAGEWKPKCYADEAEILLDLLEKETGSVEITWSDKGFDL